MRTKMTLKLSLAIALMTAIGLNAAALDGDKPDTQSGMMYAPLVFDNRDAATADKAPASTPYSLDAGDQWLQDAMSEASRTRQVRQRAMIENPQLVAYNANRLPEAPPEAVITGDPHQGMLTIAPAQVAVDEVTPPAAPVQPIHNWLHVFNASLQFTQAYISGNWYQGGENNLALLGSINWNCNLNQDVHPNWLLATASAST